MRQMHAHIAVIVKDDVGNDVEIAVPFEPCGNVIAALTACIWRTVVAERFK